PRSIAPTSPRETTAVMPQAPVRPPPGSSTSPQVPLDGATLGDAPTIAESGSTRHLGGGGRFPQDDGMPPNTERDVMTSPPSAKTPFEGVPLASAPRVSGPPPPVSARPPWPLSSTR